MRDLAIAQLAQVVAEDLDLAAAGLIHGGDQVQQRGLARSSGRAHRRDELALPDGDADFLQRDDVEFVANVFFGKTAGFNNRFSHDQTFWRTRSPSFTLQAD